MERCKYGYAECCAQLFYDTGAGATETINAAFPRCRRRNGLPVVIDGSATIASTVGSNNLTKTGTVTQVNGWAADYAGKGDGSTGYYASANSTGFPTGAAVRQLDFVVTIGNYSTSNGLHTELNTLLQPNLGLSLTLLEKYAAGSLEVGQTLIPATLYRRRVC